MARIRVPGLAAALALLALAAGLAACQETEEDTSQAATDAPAASNSPTITSPASTTPEPVPDDWPTYSDSGGLFTVRYPPNWFEKDGDFYPRDPETLKGASLYPETVVVEFSYMSAVGSDTCGGTISVDANTGQELGPLAGATPVILGGLPAWQMVKSQADRPNIGPLTKIHGISAIDRGQCFLATAYFTQQDPDDAIFLRIAGSLRFLGDTEPNLHTTP